MIQLVPVEKFLEDSLKAYGDSLRRPDFVPRLTAPDKREVGGQLLGQFVPANSDIL